jgi:hypothetical protein
MTKGQVREIMSEKRECQVCSTYGKLVWAEKLQRWICAICVHQGLLR